jgi:hypothetical protein
LTAVGRCHPHDVGVNGKFVEHRSGSAALASPPPLLLVCAQHECKSPDVMRVTGERGLSVMVVV